jgi:hypothetical protein
MGVIHNQQEKIQKLVDFTIAKDGSLSTAIDCRGFRVAKIFIYGWTAADLTFAESADSTVYGPLKDDAGIDVSVEISANDVVAITINALAFADVCYLKIRSGTVSIPVTQAAERTGKVLLSSL